MLPLAFELIDANNERLFPYSSQRNWSRTVPLHKCIHEILTEKQNRLKDIYFHVIGTYIYIYIYITN